MTDQLKTPLMRRKAIWEAMGETQCPQIRPLLTLEQFFLHSNNEADLWYNLGAVPEGLNQYEFHCSIRARPNVWDVLISVTQLEDIPALTVKNYDDSGWFEWPNSDHTLIVTTADEAEIRSWYPDKFQPDEIDIADWSGSEWAVPSFIPKDFHQAWLWYD